MGNVSLLLAALIGVLSWLTPNHSQPWLSFHAEAAMALAFAIALAGELARGKVRPDTIAPLTAATLLLALVPLIQTATGLIRFAGDGLVAFAYLLGFAMAQWLGQRLAWRCGTAQVAEWLAGLFVAGGMASVGLQLYQWLQLQGLGMYAVAMAPYGTPFANFAQPNHLATALFLALVGLLFVFERRRIGGPVAAFASLFILLGMVMTGSRTAWVSVALLVVLLWVLRRRTKMRLPAMGALALGMGFAALVALWPVINDVMLLSPGRSMANQAQAGPRPLFYATMLDAVSRHPWMGYGWGQGLVAQGTVIDAHPSGGRLMGNAHNTIIDLMVWNGVPVALAVVGMLVAWVWRQWRACANAAAVFLLAGLGGVAVHAMLEYPLSYAYFLLPVGLMMGLLEAAEPARWQLPLPRGAAVAAAAATAAMLTLIVVDYLEVESNTQLLAWEAARIGTGRITSAPPDVIVLTQWREYLRLARIENPHPGMTESELEWMQRTSERFPYSTPMRQLAAAQALTGRPEAARQTLSRLCQRHSAQRCRKELLAWAEEAKNSAALAAIARPPLPQAQPERFAPPMPPLGSEPLKRS